MNIVRHLLVLFRSATGGAGTLERLCARNIQRGCVAAFRRCANRQKSKRWDVRERLVKIQLCRRHSELWSLRW